MHHPVDYRSFRVPVVGRLWEGWAAARRFFSSHHRTARLLGAPSTPDDDKPGLVLIQIDGLSQAELEAAIAAGDLPTLAHIRAREGYRLHPLYSGQPSTTPAVQGELFYGRKSSVPAFYFRERRTGRTMEMLDSETAAEIETELSRDNAGLLHCGSGYSNIYAGGALEPHFCAATLGWQGMFRGLRIWSLVLAVTWNIGTLLRIFAKFLRECGLILVDLLRAVFGRLEFKREWERIDSRLFVGVVLQELMTTAACVDVTRGLQVVQLNYLSYDECGHLRGPDSPLARRALRRIDRAIARVWKAVHRGNARDYDVWIYADHGQERTTPYDTLAGRTYVQAVRQAFGVGEDQQAAPLKLLKRSRYLRAAHRKPAAAKTASKPEPKKPAEVEVTAIGPVGHIYLTDVFHEEEIRAACRRLVADHQTPLVVRRRADGVLETFTADGAGEWRRDASLLIGDDHPFRTAIVDDVERLCAHPDAGDVVTFGWRAGAKPISFVKEYGAHAGFGRNETGAFVLAPLDAPLVPREYAFLRPDDLRKAALRRLGREQGTLPARAARPTTLRIVTYNVHSCVGLDGRMSPARIARVLAQCDADVVCLQELDVGRRRTGRLDQTAEIARLLETEHRYFHPAMTSADEQYGDAVLSRLPMRLVRAAKLPGADLRGSLEPRGALWTAVEFAGGEVQIVNTHLGLREAEQRLQVKTLLGAEWLGHADCRNPAILCGDLNLTPRTKAFQSLAAEFRDAQTAVPGRRPQFTWFAPWPIRRLDHVFVRGGLEIVRVDVVRSQLARVASDHLPLVVELKWNDGV